MVMRGRTRDTIVQVDQSGLEVEAEKRGERLKSEESRTPERDLPDRDRDFTIGHRQRLMLMLGVRTDERKVNSKTYNAVHPRPHMAPHRKFGTNSSGIASR